MWQKDDRIRKSPLKFYVYYYSDLSGDCQASIITELWRLCRFVNDVLQIWERKKNLFRGTPIKRPHREVIVLALANSELLLEIMKGKELV